MENITLDTPVFVAVDSQRGSKSSWLGLFCSKVDRTTTDKQLSQLALDLMIGMLKSKRAFLTREEAQSDPHYILFRVECKTPQEWADYVKDSMRRAKLKITIEADSLGDLEDALDDIIGKVRNGFTSGMDRNETGAYSFEIAAADVLERR
jgi:hypothetical protein